MSQGLLLVFGQAFMMLLGAAAIAALVLVVVAGVRRGAVPASAGPTPHEHAQSLSELAAHAERDGVAAAAATSNTPLLARALALQGTAPTREALRRSLAASLAENDLQAIHRDGTRRLAVTAAASTLVLLVLGLSTTIFLQNASAAHMPAGLFALASVAALVAMPLLSIMAARLPQGSSDQPVETLKRTMSLEAVTLIATGASSLVVRESLMQLLPPSQRPAVAATRAA